MIDTSASVDVGHQIVRALALYGLAEYQAGHASLLTVHVSDHWFSVSDNGRGHGIDREIDGVSYLNYVYTHLDYPFAPGIGGPVQLQGIGMSLLNTLCSELRLTVRKPTETLVREYRSGRACSERRFASTNTATGNTVEGEVSPQFRSARADWAPLGEWLGRIKQGHPGLGISLNDRPISPPGEGAF